MQQSYTVKELATLTGAQWQGNGEQEIFGVADLGHALPSEASFFANPRYANALQKTQAGVVCVADASLCPSEMTLLIHEDPSRVFQRIAELLEAWRPPLTGFIGIHPTAIVHPLAKIGEQVTLCPYAVIDAEASIGARSLIGAHAYIGPKASIGEECILHAHTVVREGCSLGNRVILQPGAVIGSCGFGYTTSTDGIHTKLEQIGSAILEDDVEIGANSAVDRGRFSSQSTRIGKGSKLDNLIQIAHGVQLGSHVLIAGQSGIAGSTKLGDHCAIGGQTAIAGHLTLANNVRIAGKSGVSKSLQPGTYGGIPAQPIGEYNRLQVLVRKLPSLVADVETLKHS